MKSVSLILIALLLPIEGFTRAVDKAQDREGHDYGMLLYQIGTISETEYRRGFPLLADEWVETEAQYNGVYRSRQTANSDSRSLLHIIKGLSRNVTSFTNGSTHVSCLEWVKDIWNQQGKGTYVWINEAKYREKCSQKILSNSYMGIRAGVKAATHIDHDDPLDPSGINGLHYETEKMLPPKRRDLFDQK